MQSDKLPFDTAFIDQFNWSNPELDTPIVKQMAEDHSADTACPAQSEEFAHLARLLAGNPNTPTVVLDHLVKCAKSVQVLERVAFNPNASIVALNILSRHSSITVRCAVAENLQEESEIIQNLVGDPDVDVRFRLAENNGLSDSILLALIADENPYVAHRARLTRERAKNAGDTNSKKLPLNKRNKSVKRAV